MKPKMNEILLSAAILAKAAELPEATGHTADASIVTEIVSLSRKIDVTIDELFSEEAFDL